MAGGVNIRCANHILLSKRESLRLNILTERSIECPYCSESIDVLIDSTDIDQQYIEDCQVCCQPINFLISQSTSGELAVAVYS